MGPASRPALGDGAPAGADALAGVTGVYICYYADADGGGGDADVAAAAVDASSLSDADGWTCASGAELYDIVAVPLIDVGCSSSSLVVFYADVVVVACAPAFAPPGAGLALDSAVPVALEHDGGGRLMLLPPASALAADGVAVVVAPVGTTVRTEATGGAGAAADIHY